MCITVQSSVGLDAIKGNAKTGADARYCYYLLLTKDLHSLRGGSGTPDQSNKS